MMIRCCKKLGQIRMEKQGNSTFIACPHLMRERGVAQWSAIEPARLHEGSRFFGSCYSCGFTWTRKDHFTFTHTRTVQTADAFSHLFLGNKKSHLHRIHLNTSSQPASHSQVVAWTCLTIRSSNSRPAHVGSTNRFWDLSWSLSALQLLSQTLLLSTLAKLRICMGVKNDSTGITS